MINENTLISGSVESIYIYISPGRRLEVKYMLKFKLPELTTGTFQKCFKEREVYGTPNEIIKHLKE